MSRSDAIEYSTPEPGSYRFVLRRYDQGCVHRILVPTYAETAESRAITFDGRGQGPEEAHTLFLATDEARDRLVKLGWLDETEQWFRLHGLVDRVLDALRSVGQPCQTATLARSLPGVSAADLTAVLGSLAEEGRIMRRGTGAVVIWSLPAVSTPVGAEAVV